MVLPKNITAEWLQDFTRGLRDDLQEFCCFLAGGDTVLHSSGLVLTLTALGYVPAGQAILRSGAQAGDRIFVTGTLGDSYLGLQLLQGKYGTLSVYSKKFAIDRYHLPQPRLSVGTQISCIATSCADVSDGLLADLENICKASNVGAELLLQKLPFSAPVQEAAHLDSNFKINAITGGDDYELIFTATEAMQNEIWAISAETGVRISKIGKITQGRGVKLLGENGAEIITQTTGYKHKF
jgi:thiamine-monophosphate kinase